MLSNVESEYIKALVNTYKQEGYNYYLCHTITERYNDVDVCIYFSKEEIKASAENIFIIHNGLKITLDSSSRSYDTTISSPRILLVDNNYNSVVNINLEEFIYTNADRNYELTQFIVNPDLMVSMPLNPETSLFNAALLFIVMVTFLYLFLKNIFRLK